MLKFLIFNLLLLSFCKDAFSISMQKTAIQNGNRFNAVDSLNIEAYNLRLKYPEQTIKYATTAFDLAKKLNYLNGQGEACRVIGIGQSYISKYDKALDKYLEAISYFEQNNNFKGVGKVYNNIGNLYSLNDYEKALEYYNKSLTIAKKYKAEPEIAGLYLNIGVIQMKRKDYQSALQKFQISTALFKQLDAPLMIIQCLQNIGEVYYNLRQYEKAENILNEAYTKAQAQSLNYTLASISLTLSNVYLSQNKFDQTEKTLKKGQEYAKSLENRDLQNDYKYAFFQLKYKKGNYKSALGYLKQTYTQDSAYYRQAFSKRITLASDLFDQLENRRRNERTIARQKYITTLFVSSTIVAALLAALVFLLVIYVRRTNRSNKELTRLNNEVSQQKENLDRINHHLEDLINDRTKDLQVKKQKGFQNILYIFRTRYADQLLL